MVPGALSLKKQKRRRGRMLDEGLVKALVTIIPKNATIIDLGAGTGSLVKALRNMNFHAWGVDGTEGIVEYTEGIVGWADLTLDCPWLYGKADWGICIEVGEHIPPKFEQLFLDQIARIPTEGLVVSWAAPGQRGTGHVNCRPIEYVQSELEMRGWQLDEWTTKVLRGNVNRQFRKRLLGMKR